MQKVTVEIPHAKNYEIIICEDFVTLRRAVRRDRRYFIVTDSNIAGMYLRTLKEHIFGVETGHFIFKAGEASKNQQTVTECYKSFIEAGLDRDSVVAALGGGVTGDLAGFSASTYMRGLEYIQIPTSLLAMVDSSIGGKTGYDFEGYKNMIGTFCQPSLVYVNLSCLRTLPGRDFSTGMAECVKHAVIKDADYFEFIFSERQKIKSMEMPALQTLVKKSCEIKAKIVGMDEKDKEGRELLNFGHTVGHAVEAASNYTLSHGEAVSIGINAALNVSDLAYGEKSRITSLLSYFDLPLTYKADKEIFLKYLFKDKKIKSGALSFIKLKSIGEAYKTIINDPRGISSLAEQITGG